MGGGQSASEIGGFRVFKVSPNGPAFEAGLEVFFDFIVEINGVNTDSDQNLFFQKIQEAESKRTKLKVFNIRTNAFRDVLVTPRRWGGAGLLGAVVRYDHMDTGDSQGIRVLEVFPNSPAKNAGLVSKKDYLLGTTEVMFRDLEELIEIVNMCLGKEMQMYVYNSDTEMIRQVTISPNTSWGGDGAFGADIRTGLLHRIPAPRRNFSWKAQQAGGRQLPEGADTLGPPLVADPSTSQFLAGSFQAPLRPGEEFTAATMAASAASAASATAAATPAAGAVSSVFGEGTSSTPAEIAIRADAAYAAAMQAVTLEATPPVPELTLAPPAAAVASPTVEHGAALEAAPTRLTEASLATVPSAATSLQEEPALSAPAAPAVSVVTPLESPSPPSNGVQVFSMSGALDADTTDAESTSDGGGDKTPADVTQSPPEVVLGAPPLVFVALTPQPSAMGSDLQGALNGAEGGALNGAAASTLANSQSRDSYAAPSTVPAFSQSNGVPQMQMGIATRPSAAVCSAPSVVPAEVQAGCEAAAGLSIIVPAPPAAQLLPSREEVAVVGGSGTSGWSPYVPGQRYIAPTPGVIYQEPSGTALVPAVL